MTATGRDLDALLLLINSELPAIYDWIWSNKLTLNLGKPNYVVFQLRQKLNYNLCTPLKLVDQYLEQSHSVNYLGLVITRASVYGKPESENATDFLAKRGVMVPGVPCVDCGNWG